MCGLHAPAGRTYGLLYLYLCTGGKRGNDQPFSGTASAVSYCAGEKISGNGIFSTAFSCTFSVGFGTKHPAAEIGDTIRLFPHHLHGEGHFVAVLEKEGTVSQNYRGYCANGEEKPLAKGEAKAYLAGLQEFLGKIPADDAGRLLLFGEQLYLMPEHMPATRRLHVLRPGLHLGTVKKNRLEPAHALALAISPQEACHSWNLSVDEARAYLAGQTFPAEGEKGWYLITVDGYSLGWGKLAGSVMKNHYPKGLRKLL